MKFYWKRQLFAFAIMAVTAVVAVHYYPAIPDTMPSHFDFQGDPNGWMHKASFYAVMCGMIVFIYLLFTFLPFFDPLKKKIEPKFKNILFFRDALLVFFAVIFSLSLEAGREGHLNVDIFGFAFGLLLVVVGNYMPKIPQNWFIGIRTPWTISSEIVWKKTHILGGWLFMLSGVTYLFCASIRISSVIPFVLILISAAISVLYSFYLFKKNEKLSTRREN